MVKKIDFKEKAPKLNPNCTSFLAALSLDNLFKMATIAQYK